MVLRKEHLAPLKMGGNSETASEEGKVRRGRRPEEERPLGEGSLGGDSIDILFWTALTQALTISLSNAFLNASLTLSLTQALNFKCLLNCTPGPKFCLEFRDMPDLLAVP